MNASTLVQTIWNFCHTLRDHGVGDGHHLQQPSCWMLLKLARTGTAPAAPDTLESPYGRSARVPV